MGLRQRPGQLVEEAQPIADDVGAGVQEWSVPVAQLAPVRPLLPDRPQEAVPLLEGPAVGGQRRPVGRKATRSDPVEGRPAEGRGARDEEHLLGCEHDDPQGSSQARRPARHAVHPDALTAAACRRRASGPDEGDLDDVTANGALDAGQVGPPAD